MASDSKLRIEICITSKKKVTVTRIKSNTKKIANVSRDGIGSPLIVQRGVAVGFSGYNTILWEVFIWCNFVYFK